MSERMDSQFLTAEQLARLIGRSVSTVRRYAHHGVIYAYRVRGGKMRFDPDDAELLKQLLDGGFKPNYKH
jgi:excisionase family DNA binding protein